eukprot:108064-Chlamydomonas_euryale.AAC.1
MECVDADGCGVPAAPRVRAPGCVYGRPAKATHPCYMCTAGLCYDLSGKPLGYDESVKLLGFDLS